MFEELLTDLSKRQNKKVQILDQNFFYLGIFRQEFQKNIVMYEFNSIIKSNLNSAPSNAIGCKVLP